ncbi:MAG TPA: hypothetical protein VLH60_08110 [Sedimentisphaerales bacterium]|nr:hypothetical protein [Sedimentisphaerales bacterium]
MEMLKVLLDYFPTSIYTGKCLVFVSDAWRVELAEHTSRDFSTGQSSSPVIRVKICRQEGSQFIQTHCEDFHLP